jgi:predicted helicase/predicted transcriptional regulator of viral defense system
MRFEQIESRIRRDAEGTSFGGDFEWLCKWYLENAPLYRGKFRKVWRWGEWPDRWGRDCGIDLIAETTDGDLWAVQCKAVSPEQAVTKAEIDSFLSESNRKQIAYRLLIATTDSIGPNALRTIENQARHASVVLRGDLVTAELDWPSKIGGTAPKPPRWPPKPHQQAAIKDVLAGFQKHDRGKLIMACGTGKTLTGLWISEALGSRRTLLLVPSISLAQQNLKEWGRHAREDFDCLVVCSDETVATDRDDPALRYVADLGIKPTTDPKEIAAFLSKRRSRPALVISTYQSCERVSRGQTKARKWFDLAICDEAHRLVGHAESQFATVLHDRKIRTRRRLFMTATPRYFTQRAKERGAEQEIELVSMDDETKFGPEFHVLSFHDAITAKPEPLLTDYQVVVIGVTNAEAKAWVADAKLVRTKDGLETDARTLAAQIGLAKAVKQYDLTRMITFHRSIRRASRFVDGDRRDSLPAVMAKMRPANRPSGSLWARHVSGETAASKRASLLKELGELPRGTRGLISNCACLGEGVDVPTLDGVAFIDPKGSVVDIIQAVGRVIRKSGDKKIGTIIIPVFVDESEDEDHALESSAFQPVWQVLKALRAHDRRLADELDQLRTSLGQQSTPAQRIKLPTNIVLAAKSVSLPHFADAFYVRVVNKTTQPPTQKDLLLDFVRERKFVRSKDFEQAGISRVVIQRAVARGLIVQRARGVYGMPDFVLDRGDRIAIVALQTPRAVVCLLTAAEIHGLTVEVSEQVWLMLHKSSHKPVDNSGHARVIRASGDSLTAGIDRLRRNGHEIQVTTPAKTVADCFKYRATIGDNTAISILKKCLELKKATVEQIRAMADVDRVAQIIEPYLKVLG